MTSPFEFFAKTIVAANDEHLLNSGPEEQVAEAVRALDHFATTTPLRAVTGTVIDLAGFGDAPVHFESDHDGYLLLSEVAGQVGMPIWTACKWARQEHQWAIADQRREDEQRGDGLLGYDLLRNFVDLRFDFVQDDPEAKPDADGKRWSSYGDWLISRDRLPTLLLLSPWGEEYMNNTTPHFGLAMEKAWGVNLFPSDLSEDEALRKARRGPAGGISSGGAL